jgi:hypothetical protein
MQGRSISMNWKQTQRTENNVDPHWASGTKVWFVMMKDDKGRYANSKLWGDGWGWALYKSDAPEKQVAVSYKKDCQGCHIPAQKTDWIYTRGYPALHSSK